MGAVGVHLMAKAVAVYSLATILAFLVAKAAYYCYLLGQKKWQRVFLQYLSPGWRIFLVVLVDHDLLNSAASVVAVHFFVLKIFSPNYFGLYQLCLHQCL